MIVILVQVQVKVDAVQAFKAATAENARQSVNEPGIARFDVIQKADDPAAFVLIEAYRTADAVASHKQTHHYLTWRDTVVDMMAAPRSSATFTSLFPADSGW